MISKMQIRKISIIIPAFNEEGTIVESVKRVLKTRLNKIQKEIIIINDGSKDQTLQKIKTFKEKRVKLINKKKNEGKGAAIKDALRIVSGDVIVIQDADLEYEPKEYLNLLSPIKLGLADVVYGSRFTGSGPHRVLFFWHMLGNKFLTLLSNTLTNLNLTDMETCYKMFTKEVAQKLKLEEGRFGFEPEFTIKIAKMGARVYEVGISYMGRSYTEGKKINWRDGLRAVWCLFKYSMYPEAVTPRKISHFQKKEPFMERILQYLRFKKIQQYIKPGITVLDLGCGYHGSMLNMMSSTIRNGVGYDIGVTKQNTASNILLYRKDIQSYKPKNRNIFDLVVALAVLEHLKNPLTVIGSAYKVLKPGGKLLITTPNASSKILLETLATIGVISKTEISDHKLYYTVQRLRRDLRQAGFKKTKVSTFEMGFNIFAVAEK